MNMLDKTSRRIIECLQCDATLSVQQLAEAVGLSPTPVWRRLKALEDAGVVRARVTLMDREKLGLAVCVLAHVTLVRHTEGVVEDFEREQEAIPRTANAASATMRIAFILS
jgi:DNA-binding Lrp family transcriptional regulator